MFLVKNKKILLSIIGSLIVILLIAIVIVSYNKNTNSNIDNISGDSSLSGDSNIIHKDNNVVVEIADYDADSGWNYMVHPEVIITKNGDTTVFKCYGFIRNVYVNDDVVSIMFRHPVPESGYTSYSVRNYSVKTMEELSSDDVAKLKNKDLDELYSDILSIIRENCVSKEEYDSCKKLLKDYDDYQKQLENRFLDITEIQSGDLPERFRNTTSPDWVCEQVVESYEDSTTNIKNNTQLYLDNNGDICAIISYKDPLLVAGTTNVKQFIYTIETNKVEELKHFNF